MANIRPIFPGVFTVGSVLCGFYSIISAAEGNPTRASWLILLAGLLDGFDGKVARLSGGASDLGREFDSLADFISFGVAPAFLVYTFKLNAFGNLGWVIGLIYIVASGYRLARFNLLAQSEEKGNFLGLPVPMAAVTLSSFILFCIAIWGQVEYHEYIITMMILFSALMVSQIEYDALPDKFNTKANRLKLLYVVIVGAAVLIKPSLLIFPLFILYIVFGLVREGLRIVKNANSGVSGEQ
ncbi:MAG: CDP-diacylglycerol--serine O-phosphatidyltransferase [Candidatus Zixiibacteriota bacterium]